MICCQILRDGPEISQTEEIIFYQVTFFQCSPDGYHGQRGEGRRVEVRVEHGRNRRVAEASLGHRRPGALLAVEPAVRLDEDRAPRLGLDLQVHGPGDGIHREKLNPWVVEKLKKLNQARSRLYRNQILQVNTRWKALGEIYTMHSFAPFSNLNFFVKNC